MGQSELSSRRSYPVAWTIVIRCFTACLTATSGKFSLSRMPPLDFLLELDGGNTSRRCCASCTGFQSRVELTSNWHVLSSRLSLVMHLRTCLTTYIWSRKGLDVTCARLPTDHVLFQAHTTHSVTEVSLSRGPRVWNSLPGHLRDEDITYSSFRREQQQQRPFNGL